MTSPELPMTCAEFEGGLSDYMEGTLGAAGRAAMDAHAANCSECAALASDLQQLVATAAVLPRLSPSHDLWAGIAERIDAPVASIAERTTAAPSRRLFSLRQFAAAAVALVTVSSGATYLLTRGSTAPASVPASAFPTQVAQGATATSPNAPNSPAAGAQSVGANATAANTSDSMLETRSGNNTPSRDGRLASYSSGSVEHIYEHEITSMRRIVDERLGDLDSATVVEIERNLAIIDKAIADSRRALAKDPRSGFLSTQLDRALETKLSTLRRVALL